jgi:threonine dehydrogenase-like Zn-dependent dehydrogenase
MLGCSSEIPKLDLTFTWARELEIRGFLGYGMEEWKGERVHTMELAQRLVLESGAPVERMVTHTFPLAEYRKGLAAAGNHRASGAIKVLLEP